MWQRKGEIIIEPIYFGTTNLSKLYAGSTEITKAYIGATEVYSGQAPPFNYIGNSASLTSGAWAIAVNNSFVYTATTAGIRKYHESNLVFVGTTTSLSGSGAIYGLTANGGKLFVGTGSTLRRFFEGNLASNGTQAIGGQIYNIVSTTSHYFVASGAGDIKQYHLGNSVLVGNTASTGFETIAVAVTNDTIFAGYFNSARSYYLSNRALKSQVTFNVPHRVQALNATSETVVIASNNSSNSGAGVAYIYHASNLAIITSSNPFGNIHSVATGQGNFYLGVGNDNPKIRKLSSTGSTIADSNNFLMGDTQVGFNNGFVYVVGGNFVKGILKYTG